MAHRKRARMVGELVDRLGVDADRVVWDRNNDRWDTGTRAWRHHDPDADWHLVLQDDAVVCRDLVRGLGKALDRVPASATVSLYLGNKGVGRTAAALVPDGVSWVRMPRLVWGVAMCVPVYTITDMLRWCRSVTGIENYDTRVGLYYRNAVSWPSWHTWPSLVDHADSPSLIGHRDGRNASRFIGAETSALQFDADGEVWSAPRHRIPPSLEDRLDGEVLVATRSFRARIGRNQYRIRQGVTRVAAGHPIVAQFRGSFEVLS